MRFSGALFWWHMFLEDWAQLLALYGPFCMLFPCARYPKNCQLSIALNAPCTTLSEDSPLAMVIHDRSAVTTAVEA